jgi:hypothetical protein
MTAQPSLYRRHRFPAEIGHAVGPYRLLNLSRYDIVSILAEYGVVVNHESTRHCWRPRMLPVPHEVGRLWS